MIAQRAQRGVALLVVLWACTLLAIVLGGYAALSRTEAMQARYQFAQTQAHYAAEAGLNRAIYALQAPPGQRWIADGRAYSLPWDGATVTVNVIDEAGKVDLNAANPDVLTGLLRTVGVADAQALSQAIVQWRSFTIDPDQRAQRARPYQVAGRSYGPRNGPFASVEELQLVLGMDSALYAQLAPVLTIWSGRNIPDLPSASPLVLAGLPGMNAQLLQQILATRTGNNATAALAGAGAVTHSIRSEAVLADGTRAVVNATVRLQGIRSSAQPYVLLRWQEGDGE
ncbi:MAG: type II secretion system protein GspK [Dyella sp.]